MSKEVMSNFEANAIYAVLAWEPVSGTNERLNVGVLTIFEGNIQARPLIREDVLRCMYGQAGDGAFNMIQSALKVAEGVAEKFGFDSALDAVPLTALKFNSKRETRANNIYDLYRQIVLMHCSLSVLSEEPTSATEDTPTPDREVNRQWMTKVKEVIANKRPDLSIFFNREMVLAEGGSPVKFPFLNSQLAAQFGLLKANTQNQGMEDARARMWKLDLARKVNSNIQVAMILGIPHLSDVTISDKSLEKFKININDLKREAEKYEIRLKPVETTEEAADFVIAMA